MFLEICFNDFVENQGTGIIMKLNLISESQSYQVNTNIKTFVIPQASRPWSPNHYLIKLTFAI